MKRVKIIQITLATALIIITFGCEKQNHFQGSVSSTILSEENYAIFPSDYESLDLPFNKKRFTLTSHDAKKATELMETKWQHPEIKNLEQYKVQMVGYLNDRGEKNVWLNYFCKEVSNWTKSLVIFEDGDSCFFNIKLNLSTEEIFDLRINGAA